MAGGRRFTPTWASTAFLFWLLKCVHEHEYERDEREHSPHLWYDYILYDDLNPTDIYHINKCYRIHARHTYSYREQCDKKQRSDLFFPWHWCGAIEWTRIVHAIISGWLHIFSFTFLFGENVEMIEIAHQRRDVAIIALVQTKDEVTFRARARCSIDVQRERKLGGEKWKQ